MSSSLSDLSCLGLTAELVSVVANLTYLICSRKGLDVPPISVLIVRLVTIILEFMIRVDAIHQLVYHLGVILTKRLLNDIVDPAPHTTVSLRREVLV